MAPATRTDRLRRTLRAKLEEQYMLLVLARQFGPEDRQRLDENIADVDTLPTKRLEMAVTIVTAEVQRWRSLLKAEIPASDLRQLLRDRLTLPEGQQLFLPKYVVRAWVPGLEELIPKLCELPEGARISFDLWGILPRGPPGELRILEATLFEDMALHYNAAVSLTSDADALEASDPRRLTIAGKLPRKRRWAALRAAMVSGFFSLEAYLNSLAFDHLVHHGQTLTERELQRLTEWEVSKKGGPGRERYVSLRDKLLQYPRIILAREEPPLQESNCEPMRSVLDYLRVRDAVVHASPKIPFAEQSSDKELEFMAVDLDTVTAIVDAVIELIAAVETVVHGSADRLFWLERRGPDGVFPEATFA